MATNKGERREIAKGEKNVKREEKREKQGTEGEEKSDENISPTDAT